jgi:REP element-mobilizing transposase RayT
MSFPRQLVPGATYFITRRCFQRQLLLRPDPEINQILRYCLAQAALRSPVKLHAFYAASNHYHALATDIDGNLPDFLWWLNLYVAKCVNARMGRWESVWAPGSYSAIEVTTAADFLARFSYTLANPVESRLVEFGGDWPGLRFGVGGIGPQRFSEKRPEVFFDPAGEMPQVVSLELVRPKRFFRELSSEAFGQRVRAEVLKREKRFREEARIEGKPFLGVERVLKQKPTDYPWTGEPRRRMNPRVACQDKWKRIELVALLESFYLQYREALKRWRAGDHEVVFPFGTYWMRVFHGARCEVRPAPT